MGSGFCDDEKVEVIQKIVEYVSSQGADAGADQIVFPAGREDVEGWVNDYAPCFRTKRIVEVALNNSELAPSLIGELGRRKEYGSSERILQHYKGGPVFEYCVRKIESVLKDDGMGDGVLMALSNAIMEAEESRIVGHEVEMKKEKKTARPLAEYQRLLKIPDEELRALSRKELLLVGGGLSPLKEELIKRGVVCTVTNIDPMAEPSPVVADKVIAKDFFDVALGEGGYDEVLALHSLPTYAFTPEQVRIFYIRSILSLKKAGILRITPIDNFSDAFTPAMRLSRKPVNNASKKFVERLKERPDLFSVTEFSIEHKGALGKKTEMPGVKIVVVGGEEQIRSFLSFPRT